MTEEELKNEFKSPDELFEEIEEEEQKLSEQQLIEQGLKVIERTIIDYRERGFTIYLYTLEDQEPLVASIRLDKIDKIRDSLENWVPVKAKLGVKSRVIGIDGMKEEILESRIRAIVNVEEIRDFRLPWQKITVSRKNRIFIRKESSIIFFEETENAVALEDYMRSKGYDTLTIIALIGGNKKIEDLDEQGQIKGIYWLTKEMWQSLKERLMKKESEAKEGEVEEKVEKLEEKEPGEKVGRFKVEEEQ